MRHLCWTVICIAVACKGGAGTDTDLGVSADPDTNMDSDSDSDSDSAINLFEGYAFPSRFDGADSVSYSGQVFRQVLIEELKNHVGGLTERIDSGFFPVLGEVADELDFYLSFDSSTSGQVPLTLSTSPALLQVVYDDISADKNLAEKLAGNDPVGQHENWSADLEGWGSQGSPSPEVLVRSWFSAIDRAAVDRSNGIVLLDPLGVPLTSVALTPDGLDHQQLIDKFLRGAVAFSQGTDDYLDDDEQGKGLLSDHDQAVPGENYTALEHAWDEGFGYFGATRTYGDWSDADVADVGHLDVDGDGAIDVLSELCFGASVNAAKRDVGAANGTDFTAEAFDAFTAGRGILAAAGAGLSPAELQAVQGLRDVAVEAWEQAMAATLVHYLNEVLADMGTFDTADYDFAAHAKHWSEAKGFALALQFNPRSPLSRGELITLHEQIGMSPVLPNMGAGAIAQYRTDLLDARALVGAVYGFDPANLGDDNGDNGW